jgi:3-phosphoshikimate 1-carboxyvinyltransferase
MLAPLASGTSRIAGFADGADVRSTAAAMRALGVTDARVPETDVPLELAGPVELRAPDRSIDCGNSGTTARLLLGLVAGRPISAALDGDASLRRRPMARVVDPLRAAGAIVRELGRTGRLPLEIRGGQLGPIMHESPVASAQVKSALLLAGLGAGVPVTVIEPGPSRDHTERMLGAMGVGVLTREEASGFHVVHEPPAGPLDPLRLTIPGDFSSACFWIALAVLGGAGPGLRLEGVGLNPRRTGFLRALSAMGASLETTVTGLAAGEPVGDIVARPSSLRGVELPPEWVPTLIDEIPMLACLAACAAGTTVIRGAAELRVKESDRLAAVHGNLTALGVVSREARDGLEIEGTATRLAGRVFSAGDHRIAMSFGILGALGRNDVRVADPGCVRVSYPGFWAELSRIAGMAEGS